MKVKNLAALVTILVSINAFSQAKPVTTEEMLKKIDQQIIAISNNNFLKKQYNIDEIIAQVEKNKNNLPELIKISKELEGTFNDDIGRNSICVC